MDTKAFYEEISERYYAETFGELRDTRSLARALRTEAVLKMVDKYVSRGSLVADLGCGPAQYAEPLLKKGFRYLGLDFAPDMYQTVAAKLAGNADARFTSGSIESIPLGDRSVDAALVVGVMEYLASDDRALREIARVLKPAGIAIVTFPNGLSPMHALRTVVRPVVAPMLRKLGCFEDTVFVSGVAYRVFIPYVFRRKAEKQGLTQVEMYRHGYHLELKKRRIDREDVQKFIRRDYLDIPVVNYLGMDCILCLRNT